MPYHGPRIYPRIYPSFAATLTRKGSFEPHSSTAVARSTSTQFTHAYTRSPQHYCAEVRSRLDKQSAVTVQQSAATAHPYPQLLRTLTRSHCAHSPQYLIGEDWWMQSSLILCIATSEMYINPGCRAIVIHLTIIPHHLHCASTATETLVELQLLTARRALLRPISAQAHSACSHKRPSLLTVPLQL